MKTLHRESASVWYRPAGYRRTTHQSSSRCSPSSLGKNGNFWAAFCANCSGGPVFLDIHHNYYSDRKVNQMMLHRNITMESIFVVDGIIICDWCSHHAVESQPIVVPIPIVIQKLIRIITEFEPSVSRVSSGWCVQAAFKVFETDSVAKGFVSTEVLEQTVV